MIPPLPKSICDMADLYQWRGSLILKNTFGRIILYLNYIVKTLISCKESWESLEALTKGTFGVNPIMESIDRVKLGALLMAKADTYRQETAATRKAGPPICVDRETWMSHLRLAEDQDMTNEQYEHIAFVLQAYNPPLVAKK